ncbi:Lipoprotein [Pseudomonas syringae pv. cilantro]|uniref:Lipoprotein n=1 Tax=Pseudomonas syringae pv. cilantro TaxID=81035 RepID=A0A0N0X8C1_PSESX|nr:Lipoprotein [Pseudomonas syringae pv. cilantro]
MNGMILTGIGAIIGTVGCLWFYGYLHFARPEDALLLSEFTLLKTVPGEDYKIAATPAAEVAQCIDGVLVLFDTSQKGLSGVLINDHRQAVRCIGQQTPRQ